MILFPNKRKALNIKIAYAVSRLSEPFLLLIILGVTIFFSDYLSEYNRLAWGLMLILFIGVLPLLTLWLGVNKLKKVDIDFTKKEKRTPFILIILFYWFLALILTWALRGPGIIFVILLIGIIINLIVLFVNFYWKISNHSLTLGAVSFFINQLFGWQYWWLFLFIPLVAWSRWVQRKHTWWQLTGGVGLSVVAWWLLRIIGY